MIPFSFVLSDIHLRLLFSQALLPRIKHTIHSRKEPTRAQGYLALDSKSIKIEFTR
jgi:hypothetical protein